MKQASLVYTLASPALVRCQATVAGSVDSNDVLDGYVSYSIEFASFPEFAGQFSQLQAHNVPCSLSIVHCLNHFA